MLPWEQISAAPARREVEKEPVLSGGDKGERGLEELEVGEQWKRERARTPWRDEARCWAEQHLSLSQRPQNDSKP